VAARPTRSLILDAALELFAAHGYAGASIRQIARAVGVTESGIYAHFAGKEEIYRTLFEEAGPGAVMAALADASAGVTALAEAHPAEAVRELVRRVMTTWSEPRARRFTSLILRDATLGAQPGGFSLTAGVASVQRRFGGVFRRWIERGLVRGDFAPEHLVWELMAPLINVRILFLHAQATPDDLAAGTRLADRHVDFFLACVLLPRASGAAGTRPMEDQHDQSHPRPSDDRPRRRRRTDWPRDGA
jgi:AcrR family transcriptional regulator